MPDKRREQRVEEETKVTIRVLPEDKNTHDKNVVFALTKDISSGGLKILTDKMLPVNTLLNIELTLAKLRKLVTVNGRVRWVKRLYDDDVFEMGLEFVDTPPESVILLLENIYGTKDEDQTKK
jgi:c-di-GMP-binding flagellar brake protein YcgR